MTRTFCDRCGAEIKEREWSYISNRIVYVKMRLLTHQKREDWKEDEKTLCTRCEDSYIHWFMNPKTEDDTNDP